MKVLNDILARGFLLSVMWLLVGLNVWAQTVEIHETVTNFFRPTKYTPSGIPAFMDSGKVGVQSLLKGNYRDSLARRFDKIEQYYPLVKDTAVYRYYHAIFGNDTIDYSERKPVIYDDDDKHHTLEVESRMPPFQRFEAVIDGLSPSEIDALKDSMWHMSTSQRLMNNEQTCIFYALNCLYDDNGTCTAPMITRNTNFVNGRQLNAFFRYFLVLVDSLPCKYKELRKATWQDNCVLVFQNTKKEFIHAVFYRCDTGEYYSKNGMFPPVILADLRPVVESYGRYDTKDKALGKAALDQLADTVQVYCYPHNKLPQQKQ